MGIEETLYKIKTILEQKYRVKNVGFGIKTFDEKWPNTPYMEFDLVNSQDSDMVTQLMKYFQKRVQKGKTKYVTTYVENPEALEKQSTRRVVPVVIKKGSNEEKQRDLEEMAERFYNSLEHLSKVLRL